MVYDYSYHRIGSHANCHGLDKVCVKVTHNSTEGILQHFRTFIFFPILTFFHLL